MASSSEYADFIRDKFARLEVVTIRPMMGEYVIHMAGKVLGFIVDDRLVLEPGPTIDRLLPDAERTELFPGSKLFVVVDDGISAAKLCEIAAAIYDDLPVSKPRKPRKPRGAAAAAGEAAVEEKENDEGRFSFAKHIKW